MQVPSSQEHVSKNFERTLLKLSFGDMQSYFSHADCCESKFSNAVRSMIGSGRVPWKIFLIVVCGFPSEGVNINTTAEGKLFGFAGLGT